jgi:hypothetical protein
MLFDQTVSFLDPQTNTIGVCKNGSTLILLVNGKSVFSCTNTAFSSGKIGFFVGAGDTVRFDDVIVTDQVTAPAVVSCFSDDFAGTDHEGWYIDEAVGGLDVGGGSMDFSLPANFGWSPRVYTTGDYSGASIRAIFRRTGGSLESIYGICFVERSISGGYIYTRTFGLVVNGDQRWGIMNPDSTRFAMNVPTSVVHGTTDTLEISWNSGSYRMLANGTALDANFNPGRAFEFFAAGLYVDPDLNVSVDDFWVAKGSSPFCPATFTPRPYRGNVAIRGGGRTVLFDVKGRLLSTSAPAVDLSQLLPHGVLLRVNDRAEKLVEWGR